MNNHGCFCADITFKICKSANSRIFFSSELLENIYPLRNEIGKYYLNLLSLLTGKEGPHLFWPFSDLQKPPMLNEFFSINSLLLKLIVE